MKKIIAYLIFIIVLTSPFSASCITLSAQSAVLIESETGRVIFGKNSEKRMGMASTTKIMTALVTLDKYNPDEVVIASKKASYTEGSSIYLKIGEKMSMEHILYGLMLASGNDAAVALAEHIGETEYMFVEYMNSKAEDLGLENTHFENPNGLSNENHYTTAYDLAMITREAMKNDIFRNVVSTKNKVLNSLSGENDRYIKNHNKLLWQYEGCIGVKTGFTKKDGRCLVSAAKRGDVELIAVTLNAPDDWNDHKEMFDFGFDALKKREVIKKDESAGEVYVSDGVLGKTKCVFNKNLSLYVKDDENIKVEKFISKELSAPVEKGETAGYAEIYIDNKKVGNVDIVTKESIDITLKSKVIQQFINLLIELIK